jgi:hypothetical protein
MPSQQDVGQHLATAKWFSTCICTIEVTQRGKLRYKPGGHYESYQANEISGIEIEGNQESKIAGIRKATDQADGRAIAAG